MSADESLIEFWLTCTVEVDGQGEHEEHYRYFFQPNSGTYSRAEGSTLIDRFEQVIQLDPKGANATVINGGRYHDKLVAFEILEVGTPERAGNVVVVPITVRFTRIPNGWKVVNSNREWGSPRPDR